jgi:hypothetical protein
VAHQLNNKTLIKQAFHNFSSVQPYTDSDIEKMYRSSRWFWSSLTLAEQKELEIAIKLFRNGNDKKRLPIALKNVRGRLLA